MNGIETRKCYYVHGFIIMKLLLLFFNKNDIMIMHTLWNGDLNINTV